VSARHQVNGGTVFRWETGPAEETSFFVRCGSLASAISP